MLILEKLRPEVTFKFINEFVLSNEKTASILVGNRTFEGKGIVFVLL